MEGSPVDLDGDLPLGIGKVDLGEDLPVLAEDGVVGDPPATSAREQPTHSLLRLRA